MKFFKLESSVRRLSKWLLVKLVLFLQFSIIVFLAIVRSIKMNGVNSMALSVKGLPRRQMNGERGMLRIFDSLLMTFDQKT